MADNLPRCICNNGQCRKCQRYYAKPKWELPESVLEYLRQVALRSRD